MQYNQPYGAAPNAPYVNGDPSIGRAGSIPPAAAIENPQRELVQLISNALLTPTDADLQQVSRAIQTGRLNFGQDTGTANNLVLALAPAPAQYYDGMPVRIRVAANNTGASQITMGTLDARAILRFDGSQLQPLDLPAGQVVELIYNLALTAFVLVGTNARVLTAPRTYYVNGASGSDSNTGLSSGAAFATVQKAIDTAVSYNQNGFLITILVADWVGQSYGKITIPPLNGSGGLLIQGNPTSPENVVLTASFGMAVFNYAQNVFLRGLTLKSLAGATWYGSSGVFCTGGSITLTNCNCAGSVNAAIAAAGNGTIVINGQPDSASDFVRFSAGSPQLFYADSGGYINIQGPILDFSHLGAPITTVCCYAINSGKIVLNPLFNGIAYVSGPSDVAGSRYYAAAGGIINVQGAGPSYLPGNSAGTAVSPGAYL